MVVDAFSDFVIILLSKEVVHADTITHCKHEHRVFVLITSECTEIVDCDNIDSEVLQVNRLGDVIEHNHLISWWLYM